MRSVALLDSAIQVTRSDGANSAVVRRFLIDSRNKRIDLFQASSMATSMTCSAKAFTIDSWCVVDCRKPRRFVSVFARGLREVIGPAAAKIQNMQRASSPTVSSSTFKEGT